MCKHKITPRVICGAFKTSAGRTILIEKEIALYLGLLKKRFEPGELDENFVENTDETTSF